MEETTSVRLRKALDIRNMKQIDLSIKTGIGKSAISQYLSGKVIPKQDKLYLIAKAINVQESWLMGHNVPMEPLSDSNENKNIPKDLKKILEEKTILFDGELMNEEDKQLIERMLTNMYYKSKEQNKRK